MIVSSQLPEAWIFRRWERPMTTLKGPQSRFAVWFFLPKPKSCGGYPCFWFVSCKQRCNIVCNIITFICFVKYREVADSHWLQGVFGLVTFTLKLRSWIYEQGWYYFPVECCLFVEILFPPIIFQYSGQSSKAQMLWWSATHRLTAFYAFGKGICLFPPVIFCHMW